MEVTREAGKLGIPGLYVTGDPGASDDAAKQGSLSIRIGLGWAKSHSFTTGQCPVMRYHRQLMNAILNDRCQIAKAVNATVISLDEAPAGLPGLRQGRGQEVRPRPARDARRQAAHRRVTATHCRPRRTKGDRDALRPRAPCEPPAEAHGRRVRRCRSWPGRLAWLTDDIDRPRHITVERLDTVLGHMRSIRHRSERCGALRHHLRR